MKYCDASNCRPLTLRTAGADIARGTITTSVRLTAVGAIFTGAFGFAFVTIVTVRTY